MVRLLAERGRGRPRSKIKAACDAAKSEFTKRVCDAYPGMYTSLWWAIHEGRREGFRIWAADWGSGVKIGDGDACTLWSNPLFRIVDGVCANSNHRWYRSTERQFMFQIADVAVVMHAILTMVGWVAGGKSPQHDVDAWLSNADQFSKWAGNNMSSDAGDILSAGSGSVLNFRRIMQDGVLFHARHSHGEARLNKTADQMNFDLLTFSQGTKWDEAHPINIVVSGDSAVYECNGAKASVNGLSELWPTGASDVNLASLAHIVSTALAPMNRGKVVKHIVGRMKTLIGHNNTIPPELLLLLNPTLTCDKSRRRDGCGPMLWARLLGEKGESHMKEVRKRAKSRLCVEVNSGATGVADLIWGMFSSTMVIRIHRRGAEDTQMSVPFPIVELHQDSQFYGQCSQLSCIKRTVLISDHARLVNMGIGVSSPVCNSTDPHQIDACYAALLQCDGVAVLWSEFIKESAIHLGSGVVMHYGPTVASHTAMFRSLSLPHMHTGTLTENRKCNMKDPDKFGYSWCPRKKRRRSRSQAVCLPQPNQEESDRGWDPTCTMCGCAASSPLVSSTKGVVCFLCIWETDIGHVSPLSLCSGRRVVPVPANSKLVYFPPQCPSRVRCSPNVDNSWSVVALPQTDTHTHIGGVEPTVFVTADAIVEDWSPVDEMQFNRGEKHMEFTLPHCQKKWIRKPFVIDAVVMQDAFSLLPAHTPMSEAHLEEECMDPTFQFHVRTNSEFCDLITITESSAFDLHSMLMQRDHFDEIESIFGCHFGSKVHMSALACVLNHRMNGGCFADLAGMWRGDDGDIAIGDGDMSEFLKLIT